LVTLSLVSSCAHCSDVERIQEYNLQHRSASIPHGSGRTAAYHPNEVQRSGKRGCQIVGASANVAALSVDLAAAKRLRDGGWMGGRGAGDVVQNSIKKTEVFSRP